MANQLYLQDFEDRLQKELLQICTSYHFLDGVLLSSEDLDKRWNEIAPEYMVDAVANIKEYPMVSVAWAAYLGMAIAHGWDKNWEIESRKSYSTYYGDRGFDDMDENILQNVLGLTLNSLAATERENMVRRCAQIAVTTIRKEEIEPQSNMAFHIFARSCKVLFRIGAAIELKQLGYKFEKIG
ncbi:MAG: hypothetical protein U0L67_04565 [Paludibacteraceae bacterium]|jgi:hypothetical protein|nr:hypothetical protein [Paludibacteraceae bacterium]MEE0911701.1 hypothetical protein [Paludibacteraceae bacterium]